MQNEEGGVWDSPGWRGREIWIGTDQGCSSVEKNGMIPRETGRSGHRKRNVDLWDGEGGKFGLGTDQGNSPEEKTGMIPKVMG